MTFSAAVGQIHARLDPWFWLIVKAETALEHVPPHHEQPALEFQNVAAVNIHPLTGVPE